MLDPSPHPLPFPSLSLCSEEEVTRLVHDFYARVRQEPRTAESGNVPMQQLADDVARRIGDTIWRRYQMLRWPQIPVAGRPQLRDGCGHVAGQGCTGAGAANED